MLKLELALRSLVLIFKVEGKETITFSTGRQNVDNYYFELVHCNASTSLVVSVIREISQPSNETMVCRVVVF